MNITVLKFGWEFPPHNYGGLGVACQGLVHGLVEQGVRILLVLPYRFEGEQTDYDVLYPYDNNLLQIKRVKCNLIPYLITRSVFDQKLYAESNIHLYGADIFAEVYRYEQAARDIARNYDFDIIHAHDWLSILAGIEAKRVKNKPLIVHIHATEFDRTGGNNYHPEVYEIEKRGMILADQVITVSNKTKQNIITHYGIDANKIEVIHHGVPIHAERINEITIEKKSGPIVLFLGRLTLQKGPDYFVAAAKKVLEHRNDVTFVIAGSGDMEKRLIEQVAALGIADNVLFTGFLKGNEALRMLKMADVFVMPSVSEPFGLVALEAIKARAPVIVSKNAGVCEVLSHCLTVDFWDINELANKILGVLEHKELQNELNNNAQHNIAALTWDKAAKKCINVYERALAIGR
ncbi:MAG: glycosyltransferase family 4 protein [Candidatus Babeliales bacterium]